MLVLKADVIKDVFFTGNWKRFLRDSSSVHRPEVVLVESEALLYCMGPHGLVELVTTRKVQSATMELQGGGRILFNRQVTLALAIFLAQLSNL